MPVVLSWKPCLTDAGSPGFPLPLIAQPWCCDAWCYVSPTCNAAKYGIDIGDSWTGKNLTYSYGACADWKTRPTKPEKETAGKAADLSQYSCATCPWSEAYNKTSNYYTGRTCPAEYVIPEVHLMLQ